MMLDMAYVAGVVLTSPAWAYRLWSTGKWRSDWSGRLGRGGTLDHKPGSRTILFHAVSVGETNLIRPLVDHLANRDSTLNLVIATTTNTGFERACQLYGQRHDVVRYPLDFSWAVQSFLDRVQPNLVATVELEVWPHLTQLCQRRQIPVCVINGRISDRSFPRYQKFGMFLKPTFGRLSGAAMQTRTYAQRIIAMGAPAENVCVLDTMKWDSAELADNVPGTEALAQAMGIDRARPVVVLGSTGDTEEERFADALQKTLSASVQIIMVPRKPERFEKVADCFPGIVRRSDWKDGEAGRHGDSQRLFLVDTLGELRKVYCLADVVVVGRSFNGWGASDPIEPIALGKPTVIGPDHRNFTEVVEAFEQAKGIVVASDVESAAQQVSRLLSDKRYASELACSGRAVIRARLGATQRHADFLLKLLDDQGSGKLTTPGPKQV